MTVSRETAKAEANTRYIFNNSIVINTAPNNGMHSTANSVAFIESLDA
jgi:hypothetical protein